MIFDKPFIDIETIYDDIDIQEYISKADVLLHEGRGDLGFGMYCDAMSPDLYDLQKCIYSDRISYIEYLLTLRWLACLPIAFRETRDEKYVLSFQIHIGKFFEVYCNSNNEEFLELSNSEYVVCVRNQVFMLAMRLFETQYKQKMLDSMVRGAKWQIEKIRVFNNNHELIKCDALLRASIFFWKYDFSKNWARRAIEMVRVYFKKCFSEDGVCKEGSIFYFHYNIKRFDEIIGLCEKYSIANFRDLKIKLIQSKRAFNNLIYRDLSAPLIGDSNFNRYKLFDVTWKDESSVYYDSGLCVLKSDDFVVTLKNKYIYNQAHCHCDNLSITIHFKNSNIIIDSGYYSYCRESPIMQFLVSPRAHSGIYPTIFDNITRSEYGETLIDEKITNFTDRSVTAQYTADKYGLTVSRCVTISDNVIVITDSWNCKNPLDMRQRFILNSEFMANATFDSKQKVLSSYCRECALKITVNADREFDFQCLPTFVGEQFCNVVPAMMVDSTVKNTYDGRFETTISLFKKEE